MKTKLENQKLTNSITEDLEIQELLELAKELDLRRQKEKKSLRKPRYRRKAEGVRCFLQTGQWRRLFSRNRRVYNADDIRDC